jgi:hypothetical protein
VTRVRAHREAGGREEWVGGVSKGGGGGAVPRGEFSADVEGP